MCILVYKKNFDTIHVTLLQFREILVRSLLLDTSFEKLKPGRRQQSVNRSKLELADHMLEKRIDLRASSEDTVQAAMREANHIAANKIKTLYADCDNFFYKKHRTEK